MHTSSQPNTTLTMIPNYVDYGTIIPQTTAARPWCPESVWSCMGCSICWTPDPVYDEWCCYSLVCWLVMLYLLPFKSDETYLLTLNVWLCVCQLLMNPMILSVLYIWCQFNKDQIVQFWFGTQFKVSLNRSLPFYCSSVVSSLVCQTWDREDMGSSLNVSLTAQNCWEMSRPQKYSLNVHMLPVLCYMESKAKIPLGSTGHVRLCRASRDERVERDEPCCSNMADDEQACTSLVVFMLLHTQILFVSSNKIN